ncbi:MAG: hypothetical protein OJF50_005790 [Nitrospira sp.]|nr:hypothetical protein [Nitrospira sp.]
MQHREAWLRSKINLSCTLELREFDKQDGGEGKSQSDHQLHDQQITARHLQDRNLSQVDREGNTPAWSTRNPLNRSLDNCNVLTLTID